MSNYSKLIAAALGFAALIAKEVCGLEIPQETLDKLAEVGVSAVSLYMVYKLKNKPKGIS